MTVAAGAILALFGPPTLADPSSVPNQTQHKKVDVSSDRSNGGHADPITPSRTARGRTFPSIPDLSSDDFLRGLHCCQRLQCARRFTLENEWQRSLQTLISEQQRFATIQESRARRQHIVNNHVPVILPPRGSMLAAGQYVCTTFFCAIFGVSRALVYAVKNGRAMLSSGSPMPGEHSR